MKFGEAIVKHLDALINSRVHHSYPSPVPPGPETVLSTKMDEGLFAEADFGPVIDYLRCGKGLELPDYWAAVLPPPSSVFSR